MLKNSALIFVCICCLISVAKAQTPMLDINLSKLPNGVFIKKDFHLIQGDTVYKKFEKYQTAIENGDSVLYVESFDVNRNWLVSRYIVSGKERLASGWQTEYNLNGNKIYERYCDINTGDCNRYFKYTYYPNGNIMAITSYDKKKLNGTSAFFYNDGQIKNSLEYIDDKLWNINAYYDQNGQILDQGNFCDGNGYVNVYASNGKLIKMKWFKNGKLKKEKAIHLN